MPFHPLIASQLGRVQKRPAFFSPENQNAILGLASGLLESSGYSPVPQTFGTALGRGLSGFQQGLQIDEQRTLQQQQLRQKQQEQNQWAVIAEKLGLSGVPTSALPGLVTKALAGQLEGPQKGFALQHTGILDESGRPLLFDPNDPTKPYRYGEPIKGARTPSQASVFDIARERELGGKVGTAQFSLPEQEYYAGTTSKLIDELVAHPGLDNAIGFIQGRVPAMTQAGKDFDVRREQLQGRAMLAARQMLKGGGQITDFESRKAEQAMLRAERAQSEAEFKTAMLEFKDAVTQGVEKLRQQSQIGPSGIPANESPKTGPSEFRLIRKRPQ